MAEWLCLGPYRTLSFKNQPLELKNHKIMPPLQHQPSIQAAEERGLGETWVFLFYEQFQNLQLKEQGQIGPLRTVEEVPGMFEHNYLYLAKTFQAICASYMHSRQVSSFGASPIYSFVSTNVFFFMICPKCVVVTEHLI